MRALVLLAKFAITLGFLSYLYFRIDPATALAQARQSDALTLVGGTLLLALLPVLGSIRWRTIMRCFGATPDFGAVTRWTYVGVFFGQILPATVGGDALRMWLAHRGGCSMRLAINSVGLDRVVMTLSLVILLAAVAPSLGNLAGADQLRYVSLILLAGALLGLALVMLGDRPPESLRRLRVVRAIGYLAHDARQLFLSARFLGATLSLSLTTYFTIFASVSLFALAFGAVFTWWKLIVLLPPVLFVSTLPISIGGWGTREMAMVVAFGSIGIDPNTAILVSLWLGVASILISVPGGILYLTDRAPLKPPGGTKFVSRP